MSGGLGPSIAGEHTLLVAVDAEGAAWRVEVGEVPDLLSDDRRDPVEDLSLIHI